MNTSLKVRKGGIAVIGDEFFTLSLRLGGAIKHYILSKNLRRDELRKRVELILSDVSKSAITLLVIQESLREVFREVELPKDVLTIFIPSVGVRAKFDVTEHYLSLIRKYLGISIELR